MKGMQKIKRGKQFTGVVVYALEPASHHKTDPRVIGGNMAGNHIVDLIREFGQTKLLRPDIKKPVWQFTLLPVVSILLTESCIWEKMRTLPALELSVSLKEYMVSQKQRLLQTDDLRA